ncbi:MAG: hypothetical protein AB1505_28615 [Candidatus Latescibacterota bacterium]
MLFTVDPHRKEALRRSWAAVVGHLAAIVVIIILTLPYDPYLA